MYVFLGLNGKEIKAEVVKLMVAIADGQRSEREIAVWLRRHLT